MNLQLFVASGVASSLFSSLLPFLRYCTNNPFSGNKITGIVRPTTDEGKLRHRKFLRQQGVKLIEMHENENIQRTLANWVHIYGGGVEKQKEFKKNTRILWLSTHDDAKTLAYCASLAPTIAIGSGAMLDFLSGKIDITNADDGVVNYVQGKLRMALTPDVTTLVPGFFLEDDIRNPLCPTGLHLDTTEWLLEDVLEPDYNWGKGKYVTPKTFICEIIRMWIINPDPYLGKWFHCGSSRTYQRWEIREGADLDVEDELKVKYPATPEEIYFGYATRTLEAFGVKLDSTTLKNAFKRAKQWHSTQNWD